MTIHSETADLSWRAGVAVLQLAGRDIRRGRNALRRSPIERKKEPYRAKKVHGRLWMDRTRGCQKGVPAC